MTLKDVQLEVDTWIKTYGVRYFDVLTNNAVLMEEVGELSRLLARTHGDQSFKPGEKPEDIKRQIADELADVFWVLVCLANQMDIDLSDAYERNMLKKTQRDRDRHRGNEKLQQE